MPRKKKVLPDEIQLIVDEVKKKQQEEDTKEAKKLVDEYRIERSNDKTYWDITKDMKIECFDPTLSYELTGYRPIDETHGLDFDPAPFCEAGRVYTETGHYTEYPSGSKPYADF